MPKRGEGATPKQRDAGRKNLAKGRAARKKMAEQAAAEGRVTANERWSMLLDGTLTVHDLDDDEVRKMKVRSADGSFSGRGRRLPSHLIAAFHAEQIKRAKNVMHKSLVKAAKLLDAVIDDPEASRAEQLKAADMILNRVMGKAPETIRVQADDKFTDLLNAGGVLKDVRDLSDLEQA